VSLVPDVLAGSRIEKLIGVHPRLIEAVKRICYAMHELGFALIVTDGARTVEQQAALYAQGRTKPGPIVTNADGLLRKSNHQTKDDGFGHAVDCGFLVNGQPSWDAHLPWTLFGEMAKSQGLLWGGDWAALADKPHIELPPREGAR
jgi:peptidoglycan L-alanyl-D-glutamate endopeptidase CwlK